jgi:hypothetical protein
MLYEPISKYTCIYNDTYHIEHSKLKISSLISPFYLLKFKNFIESSSSYPKPLYFLKIIIMICTVFEMKLTECSKPISYIL